MTKPYTSVLDDASRAIGALLWQLYQHQDPADPIGQLVRRALNIAPSAFMTGEQIAAARRYGDSIAQPPIITMPANRNVEAARRLGFDMVFAASSMPAGTPSALEAGEAPTSLDLGLVRGQRDVMQALAQDERRARIAAEKRVAELEGDLAWLKHGRRAAAPAEAAAPRASVAPVGAVQATVDSLMEQAQVFASAYRMVGGRFDLGDEESNAAAQKADLRKMIKDVIAAPATADGATPDGGA